MEAVDKIIEVIKEHLYTVNAIVERTGDGDAEAKRLISEARGMLICLRTLNTDSKFYGIIQLPDYSFSFGYFGNRGKWFPIQ